MRYVKKESAVKSVQIEGDVFLADNRAILETGDRIVVIKGASTALAENITKMNRLADHGVPISEKEWVKPWEKDAKDKEDDKDKDKKKDPKDDKDKKDDKEDDKDKKADDKKKAERYVIETEVVLEGTGITLEVGDVIEIVEDTKVLSEVSGYGFRPSDEDAARLRKQINFTDLYRKLNSLGTKVTKITVLPVRSNAPSNHVECQSNKWTGRNSDGDTLTIGVESEVEGSLIKKNIDNGTFIWETQWYKTTGVGSKGQGKDIPLVHTLYDFSTNKWKFFKNFERSYQAYGYSR